MALISILKKDAIYSRIEKDKLNSNLEGQIIKGGEYPPYIGQTSIKPLPFDDVILNTKEKTVFEDIKIAKIPHFDVSNIEGGKTFIIGE